MIKKKPLDWALVHLREHVRKTRSGAFGVKNMDESQDRSGSATLTPGGIVFCPCVNRSWTVVLRKRELKIFCTKCKRVYQLYNFEYFKNVSVGEE